jgi:4-amino-4-deoxy-L-arabinose transferase-like glycosyltransferase
VSEQKPREPLALPVLVTLALAQLGVYGLSSGPLAYGHMSDELYYLDCAQHLAWGYVDHPPLSVAVLAVVRGTLGESLFALHLIPAVMACATVVLVGLLARELGGGRTAQGLAALATFAAPVYQGVAGFYSMNAFEPAIWCGAALLLARIANGADPRLWLALGAVLGVGLLNKISVLGLGAGLAVGLVLTRERRWLATPWPWACAAIAMALFAPHVLWQVRNDWPTPEFMRNATNLKLVSKSPVDFALEQILVISPAAVPLWLAGLVFYFTADLGRPHRVLAWIWIAVVCFLMASGSARSNYSGPAYVVLLAAGGVAVELLTRRGGRRELTTALVLLLLMAGAATAPLATPLLPPRTLVEYTRAIGFGAPRDQRGDQGPLPIHFALRFGWNDLVDAVARAHATLTPSEQGRVVVVAPSFGATAAVNFYGRARKLPPAVSGHNSYWLWGPGNTDGEVIIAIAETPETFERSYRRVERIAEVDCTYCDPELDRLSVFVCRGLRRPLDALWLDLKRFI